ncbi:MAG: helix-turn-helix domain-containing protein [Pyrinomonadaceae bacterium]
MMTKNRGRSKAPSKRAEVKLDVDDLITIREAAELRKVSVSAIGDLVRRGRLNSVQKFGRRLVSRSEVKAFEDARGWPKGKGRKR